MENNQVINNVQPSSEASSSSSSSSSSVSSNGSNVSPANDVIVAVGNLVDASHDYENAIGNQNNAKIKDKLERVSALSSGSNQSRKFSLVVQDIKGKTKFSSEEIKQNEAFNFREIKSFLQNLKTYSDLVKSGEDKTADGVTKEGILQDMNVYLQRYIAGDKLTSNEFTLEKNAKERILFFLVQFEEENELQTPFERLDGIPELRRDKDVQNNIEAGKVIFDKQGTVDLAKFKVVQAGNALVQVTDGCNKCIVM